MTSIPSIAEPGGAGARTRLRHILRPAEWVVLIFGLWLAQRLWSVPHLDLSPELGVPRSDIAAALLAVLLIQMSSEFKSAAWPDRSSRMAMHRWLLGVALFPPALQLAALFTTRFGDQPGGRIAVGFLFINWAAVQLLLVGSPLLLAWLALGVAWKSQAPMARSLQQMATRMLNALRDWAPVALMLMAYGLVGEVLAMPGTVDRDLTLHHIDQALFFGTDPIMALQGWISRPLSEWLALSYGFYGPLYPLGLGLMAVFASRRAFAELMTGLCLSLAIGYFCYTLVPAQGPLFTQHFSVPLDGYYFWWTQQDLVSRFRIPRDCFPSLHTCVNLVVLGFAWRWLRTFFWVLLPVALSVPLACVYFRYHYVADVVGGVVLAGFCLWAAPRLERRFSSWESSPGSRATPPPTLASG